MANTLTNIEPQEVVRKAHELWVEGRRAGCRGRPVVRLPANLWPVCPPPTWMGLRWRPHEEDSLIIDLRGQRDWTIVWYGRWMGKDEWIMELTKRMIR